MEIDEAIEAKFSHEVKATSAAENTADKIK